MDAETDIAGMSDAARAALQEKIDSKTRRNPETGCLEWTDDTIGGNGYGRLRVGRLIRYAHRTSFELAHGPVPERQVVRHRCNNPRCVEPSHLIAGTPQQNMDDMTSARRGRSNATNADIVAMVSLRRFDRWPVKRLAKEFGIAPRTVRAILADERRGAALEQELETALLDPEWVAQGNAGNDPEIDPGPAVEAA